MSRLCLGCQEKFDSEWAGERICPRCKGKARWRGNGSAKPDWRTSRGRA